MVKRKKYKRSVKKKSKKRNVIIIMIGLAIVAVLIFIWRYVG